MELEPLELGSLAGQQVRLVTHADSSSAAKRNSR